MTPTKDEIHDLYRAFSAADAAWSAALVEAFGKKACNARYRREGEGEPDSDLNRRYQAFKTSGSAWRVAVGLNP